MMEKLRRRLVVEGKDDEHVILHFTKVRGLNADRKVEVKPPETAEGFPAVLDRIGVEVRSSGLEAVGFVLDADIKVADRWRAIRDRLKGAGYVDVPEFPEKGGLVLDACAEKGLVRVGVWLMPDNRSPGQLEDFVGSLVSEGDRTFVRAQLAVAGIPKEERLFPEARTSKAILHTWLAWQEEPGKPMGTAITKRYLSTQGPVADAFAEWFKRCFGKFDSNSGSTPL